MPVRRAPDLAAAEGPVARWFDALPRGEAGGIDLSRAVSGPQPASLPIRAWRSLAAAAAVLLALLAPGQTDGTGAEPRARPPLAASAFAVIDDPSVPALHAFDTFEQLAWVGGAAGR